MSHLHLLLFGSILPRPHEGYVTRQRRPVEGADLAALDAEVEAAGGVGVRDTIASSSIGRGLRRNIEDLGVRHPG